MPIRPGTIIPAKDNGPHGKPVVAVIGYAGDWAAYEQSYPDQTTDQAIADNGDKLYVDDARALYPEFAILLYRP